MAVRGLEEATSRLDQVKRFGGLVVVALLISALLVGALILTGLFAFAPVPQIAILGIQIPPEWTAFIGAFTMALVIILAYVYYAAFVASSIKKVIAYWKELPLRIQAIVIAIPAAILASLSIYLSDRYLHDFEWLVIIGTGLAVGALVVIFTIRFVERGWSVTEWTRSLYMSTLLAAVLAILTAFVFAGVVPGYLPAVVFLMAWAICLYLMFRRRETIEDSFITDLLTKTGYSQMRQVDPITVSLGTGFAVALIVAIIVGLFGTTPESALSRVMFSILLVWPVVTFATSVGWPSREHFDLVIADINVRSSTEQRELSIRNLGDHPIDLREAKIADAYNTVYHLYVNTTIGAGSSIKVEIPASFEMAASDRYPISSLPAGFVLTKLASEPKIVTRNGKQYTLIWIDQLSAYRDGEASE